MSIRPQCPSWPVVSGLARSRCVAIGSPQPTIAAAILEAQKPSEINLEALQVSESEGLLTQLVTQRARLQTHSEIASELGDVRSAVACERAITSNLELVGKLLGQLVQRHEVRSTSVLISADHLEVPAALVRALQPFPLSGVKRTSHKLVPMSA